MIRKSIFFFFFTFYDIFCTFLTIIFRRSTQNGCFLHFFFSLYNVTGIHLYYLVAVILKAYVLCLAVFISTFPPTWIRQFRIGSVKRLNLGSRLSYCTFLGPVSLNIEYQIHPLPLKKPVSNRSNFPTDGESKISVSDRIFYAELIWC